MPSPSDPGAPPPSGERPSPPPPGERPPPPPPGSAEEALRRLEQRLDRATEATERLMAQAAEAAVRAGNPGAGDPGAGNPGHGAASQSAGDPGAGDTGADNPDGDEVKPPPAGWQVPEDTSGGIIPDVDPLLALVQALRDLIPPDLQRRLVAALRELLLALRALIDWYIERLERQREESVEVQDIPIL